MNNVTPAKNYNTCLSIASGAISTSTTVPTAGTAVQTGQVNQAVGFVTVVLGSLTSVNLIFQASYDGVTYYNKPLLDFSSASVTSGYYQIPIASSAMKFTQSDSVFIDIPSQYQYVRFAAYGVGTVTGSTVTVAIGSGTV